MSDSTMTRVAGYFNGNTFPIQIDISAIGMRFTLAPNEFITALANDGSGKKVKVNDPVFEAYVGRSRLSRETLKESEVPFTRIVSRDERGQVNPIQTADVKTGGDGKLVTPVLPSKDKSVGPNAPIRAFSMEEAYRRGIVRRPRLSEPAMVKETDGAPLRGESIPDIQYNDADTRQRPLVAKDGLQMPITTLDIVPDAATLPEVPRQTVAPVQTPVIPTMTLAEADDQLNKKSFVCTLDDPPKAFQFRSQLKAHVTRKFPDQAASYLETHYPLVQDEKQAAPLAEPVQ